MIRQPISTGLGPHTNRLTLPTRLNLSPATVVINVRMTCATYWTGGEGEIVEIHFSNTFTIVLLRLCDRSDVGDPVVAHRA